jgi:hypothetical protein
MTIPFPIAPAEGSEFMGYATQPRLPSLGLSALLISVSGIGQHPNIEALNFSPYVHATKSNHHQGIAGCGSSYRSF